MDGAAGVGCGLLVLATACGSIEPKEPGLAGALPMAATPARLAFELAPGVVVDPAAPRIYLAHPGIGIEALDPATGEPLWSSDEAARPLFAHGGRLLAQRESGGGLPLAILEAEGGGVLRRFEVPLPEGVQAAIDESLERRFRISSRAAGAVVLLEWEFLERDALGVSPPGGRAFARRELGALKIDLATGEARAVERAGQLATGGDPLPSPVERLVASGELAARPWRAGEVLAAVQQLYEPGRSRLVLRRWRVDTGAALPEVTLWEGRPVAVLPSADRRHLLVVSPLGGAASERERYLWTIHSLSTGEAVGSRRAERSATPFCLLASMLIHLEPPAGRRLEGRWVERPLRLRAADLAAGTELWQRPLRDTAFRGPAPPRP